VQQVGFLADVFEHFKRHGLSVDLISSAETNVTVSLDPARTWLIPMCVRVVRGSGQGVPGESHRTLCGDHPGRAWHALDLHRLSAVLAEFGPLRVHLISQSSTI